MSLLQDASLILTSNAVKSGKLFSIVPSDGTGDLDVVRDISATRVNSSGLIESVNTNVPRLDYTSGGCPSILVEPQRSNLLLQSEDFSNGWLSEMLTFSYNSVTSPNGSNNADTITETLKTDVHRFYRSAQTVTSGVNYTSSIFVKKGNVRYFRVNFIQSNSTSVWVCAQFDLDTKTFTSGVGSGGGTFVSASITEFVDGWLRLSLTGSIPSTAGNTLFHLSNGSAILSNQNRGSISYAGSTSNSLHIWGAQLELGSNATSYIPTTTATVTRNADVISKTGISDLIGQTEGTIFADINIGILSDVYKRIIMVSNGTVDTKIGITINATGRFEAYIINGSINQFVFAGSIPSTALVGRNKVALAYKSNDVAFYLNGVLIASTNTATIPACSNLYLGKIETSSSSGFMNGQFNNALLFKIRLTNSQLVMLTTL